MNFLKKIENQILVLILNYLKYLYYSNIRINTLYIDAKDYY